VSSIAASSIAVSSIAAAPSSVAVAVSSSIIVPTTAKPTTAKPTTPAEIIPPCNAKNLTTMIEAKKIYKLSDVTSTPHHVALISIISEAGNNGCGELMFNHQGWKNLSSYNAASALVVPTSTQFKIVLSNPDCDAQCHGAVEFRYAAVSKTKNNAGDRVNVSSAVVNKCVANMLLAPGTKHCPTCTIVQEFNKTINEDSGRVCYQVNETVSVNINNTPAKLGLDTHTSAAKSAYTAAISVAALTKRIQIKDQSAKVGFWAQAPSSTAVHATFRNMALIPLDKFICFRPGYNKFGSAQLKFTCAVKKTDVKKPFTATTTHKMSFTIASVNDAPIIAGNKMKLLLKALPNVYSATEGDLVSDLTAQSSKSPEGRSPLGMAIKKIVANTGTYGQFEYKPKDGAWTAMNTDGYGTGEHMLLKADVRIRFNVASYQNKYWTKTEGNKFVYMLYRAWDMSGGESNIKKNMSGSTAVSSRFGSLVQQRKGCFGPGTPGGKNDACGKCGGDNSTCAGCDKQPNSGAKYDRCGLCFGGTTGLAKTVRDCSGRCGKSKVDGCNICRLNAKVDADPNKYKDCNNTCRNAGGTAKINTCTKCVGGKTGLAAGYGKDQCGICNGDSSTCKDCEGTPNGGKTIDLCNKCLGPSVSSRDNCTALGSPSKTCVVATNTIQIPVSTSSDFANADCKFDSNAVTTVKTSRTVLTVTAADLAVGKYNISCDLTGEAKLYAKTKVHIIKYSSAVISGLVKAEDAIESGAAKQDITVTGTGFPDTGYVKCVMQKGGKNAGTLTGVYGSATSVTCKDFPKQKKSVAVTLALRFCKDDTSMTPTSATFTWTAALPTIKRANFTNCKQAVIEFTDRVEPVTAGCDVSKYFKDVSKLSTAVCSWSAKILRISLKSASLVAEDTLIFKNDQIQVPRAAKTIVANAESPAFAVNKPANRAAPKIRMRGATTIGKCAKFRVSYAIGVRAGLTIAWAVKVKGVADSTKTNALSGKQRVKADYGDVAPGDPVEFSLTATTCFGDTKTETLTITKEDKLLPQIKIPGSKTITRPVNKDTKIKTFATRKKCNVNEQAEAMSYTWEFSPAFDTTNVVGLDGYKLRIPKGTLVAGTTYTATCTVSVVGSPELSASAAATIVVESLPLVLRVDGVQSLGATQTGTFSAIVEDPDMSSDTPTYTWSLTDSTGASVQTVNFTTPVFADASSIDIDLTTLYAITAGSKYTVSVSVQKGSRSTSASAPSFEVLAGDPPKVKIVGVNGKQNWPKKIAVIAKIKSSQSGTYKWTSDDYPEVSALPGTSGTYAANVRQRANLILSPSDIPSAGKPDLKQQSYTFNLITTQADGTESPPSSVTFEVNTAPSAGVVSMDVTTGEATKTEFTATIAEGCLDDDGVSFQFGYTKGTVNVQLAVQSDNFITTTLGVGNVTVYADCIDTFGARVRALSPVISVTQPTIDKAALEDAGNAVADLAKSGNPGALAALCINLISTFVPVVTAGEAPRVQTAAEQEAELALKEGVANAMLEAAPAAGDLDAGKGFVETLGMVADPSSSLETKLKIVNSLFTMLGINKVVTAAGKRRRRSISGSSGTDPTATQANEDTDMVLKNINLQFNTNQPGTYSSDAETQKESMFSILDVQGIATCKTKIVGDPAVDIIANDATLRVVQVDFTDATAQTRALGCASSDTGCSATVQQPPFSMKVTGINQAACLTSVTMVGDYHSTVAPTDTQLSNIVRVRTWNDTAEVIPTGIDLNITLYSTANTTKSYKCMIWDDSNKVWTNITTRDIAGTLDPATLKYTATCHTTQLGDFILVEGPEIIVPEVVVASSSVVEVATSSAVVIEASSSEIVATSAAAAVTSQAVVVATSTVADAVVVTSAAAVATEAVSSSVAVSSGVAVEATSAASEAIAASSSEVAVASSSAVEPQPTIHPDNYNAKITFQIHSGNCSDAFTDNTTQASAAASAKTQVANALSVSESSITLFSLSCPANTGVSTSWTQTSTGLNDTTVKEVVQELKDMLGNGTLKITLNGNNMTLATEATTESIVPPTQPPTTMPPTTAAPTLAPENYVNDVTFTLHTGNCSDVFTDNETQKTATASAKSQIASAMGVSESSINDFALACGSVVAKWKQTSTGLTGNDTVASVIAKFKATVENASLAITINGVSLAPATTVTVAVVQPPTQAPAPDASENDTKLVKFSFSTNCTDVFNSSNKATVETSVKKDIAKAINVPESSMQNFALGCGSTTVEYQQTSTGITGTVKAAVARMQSAITGNTLNIVVNGKTLAVDTASFTSTTVVQPTQAPVNPTKAPTSPPSSGLSTGAIVGIIIGVLVLVIIVIIIVVIYMKKSQNKRQKVKPKDNDLELQERDERKAEDNTKRNPGYADSD